MTELKGRIRKGAGLSAQTSPKLTLRSGSSGVSTKNKAKKKEEPHRVCRLFHHEDGEHVFSFLTTFPYLLPRQNVRQALIIASHRALLR